MSCSGSDIVRKKGDTYPIEVTIKKETGSPCDLTGSTTIKLGVTSTHPDTGTATADAVFDGTIQNATDGVISFAISQLQADALSVGDYFAEIQFVQNGYVITTETFNYVVKGDIVTG